MSSVDCMLDAVIAHLALDDLVFAVQETETYSGAEENRLALNDQKIDPATFPGGVGDLSIDQSYPDSMITASIMPEALKMALVDLKYSE